MHPHSYYGCCIELNGDEINNMMESSRQITRKTFLKHINKDNQKEIEKNLSYDRNFPMSKDWHVGYFKGKYNNKPCYYFVHSAIEYVFI